MFKKILNIIALTCSLLLSVALVLIGAIALIFVLAVESNQGYEKKRRHSLELSDDTLFSGGDRREGSGSGRRLKDVVASASGMPNALSEAADR